MYAAVAAPKTYTAVRAESVSRSHLALIDAQEHERPHYQHVRAESTVFTSHQNDLTDGWQVWGSEQGAGPDRHTASAGLSKTCLPIRVRGAPSIALEAYQANAFVELIMRVRR